MQCNTYFVIIWIFKHLFHFLYRFSCVPPSTVKILPVIVYPLVEGARKTIESCKDNENRVNFLNHLFFD